VSAFADFLIIFGSQAPAPPVRRSEYPWRPAGIPSDTWNASIAAPSGSPLAQTREVGPWSVWLFGELTRYDALSAPADRLGAFVLDLRAGRERAALLDGHFVLFGFNADRREWHVWTNRFATMHAYVGVGARRSALGTFHPAVSAAVGATKLDWSGLSGFFSMGFFPEDRTHYERVRILRPATHYVFSDQCALISSTRYWQWSHSAERTPGFEFVVEQFGEALSQVLSEETAGNRTGVPISGGLDSRTVTAMLTDEPRTDLWLFSYGFGSRSVETRIARTVAKSRKLPCASFEIRDYLFDRLDDILAATEGFTDVTLTRQVSVAEELVANADTVVAAHWGDVWLDDSGAAEHGHRAETDTDFAAAKMMKGGRTWLLDHLCSPQLGTDPEREVREGIARELAHVSHIEDRDFRIKALKTDTWSFRWTTVGLRAYQLALFPKLPFYDARMADFFCTIPTDYVRGRRLEVAWLTRFAPDLARITWQAHDANLYLYQYANSLLLPQRAINRIMRLIRRERVIERNWEVQFLSLTGRDGLKRVLLRHDAKVNEFVSPAAIRELLDNFFSNPYDANRGYTVSMLLTFAAWLERYA